MPQSQLAAMIRSAAARSSPGRPAAAIAAASAIPCNFRRSRESEPRSTAKAADRSAVANRAVARSLQAVGGTHSVAVSETSEAITVAVTYTAPRDSLLRSSFVPSPGNVIRARATFELPVD